MHKLFVGLLAAVLVTPALPSLAGQLAGVTLPDTADAGGQYLVLNGMGLREKLTVDVYVAGLYLPAKSGAADAILAADAPRRMVMHFVHDVDKDKICEGWDDGLAANTPGASAEVKQQFATLCSWMADVEEGAALTFTYIPGQGTAVDVHGAAKGSIPGKPFADALLACWIGPKPGPGAKFKQTLLGG
jgi:hypothetical protein